LAEEPEAQIAERILELRNVNVFRPLSTLALIEIAESIEVETCDASAVLAEEGKTTTSVAWVLEGRARWTRAGEAIGMAEPGSAIGLLPTLAALVAPCSAHAAEPLRIARIGSDLFLELLEDSFDLAMSVLGAIAADLRDGGRRTLGTSVGVVRRPVPREVDFIERLVRLRMSAPFTRAPIRPLAVLAQRSEASTWPRGTTLWERGSEARTALVILAGEIREGDVRLGPGDTVGLLCALAARKRDVDTIVSAPLCGIELGVDALVDLLEDDDELALELLHTGADHLLALRAEHGLPPDIFAVAPERSLLRLPAISADAR
jgi:CRP-like cAMP-binding protein